MKKLIVICLSLIIVFSAVCVCYADKTVLIDPFTGSIVDIAGSSSAMENTGSVVLSPKCNFDKTHKRYVFPTENITVSNLYSNVYDGMIVTGTVSLTADNPLSVEVYHDGDLIAIEDCEALSEPGSYIVRDASADRQLLKFTITNKITGQFNAYDVPSIFYVSKVTLNDQPITVAGNLVPLEEEGDYVIHYANDSAGAVYDLSLTVDHTAPSLVISGLNEKRIANNKVVFGETEPNSSLTIMKDGEYIALSNTLKDAGDYLVEYSDEAGNTVSYSFKIHFFLDAGGFIFVGLLVAVLAAAFIYYLRSKKNRRVC